MEKYTIEIHDCVELGFFIHSCGGIPIGEVSEIWNPSASNIYGNNRVIQRRGVLHTLYVETFLLPTFKEDMIFGYYSVLDTF